jgi:hypothetical protein
MKISDDALTMKPGHLRRLQRATMANFTWTSSPAYLSGTKHEEDQPAICSSPIRVVRDALLETYRSPCTRFCGYVYEVEVEETDGRNSN